MIRLALLLPLALVLAACGTPVGYGESSDPGIRAAAANAEMTATQNAANAQSTQDAGRVAELQAQTERDIAIQMAPVTAQAAMLQLEITAGAATDTAARATATATTAVATAVANASRATETRAAEVAEQARADAIALGWSILWGMVIVGAIGTVIYLSYNLLKRWEDETLERKRMELEIERQKASYLPLAGGGYIWFGPNGPEMFQPGGGNGGRRQAPSPSPSHALDASWTAFEEAGPPSEPEARRDTQALVLELVTKGIHLYGGQSDRIPGFRDMGWAPSLWQRVTRSMKADGLIETTPGQETYLAEGGRYPNLQAIYYDLAGGKLIIRPAAPLPLSVAGD